ncbi:hypothetical protein [Rhizobium sp. BK661]|uniref:hypothetical protein n=1 Tax=Rhizobium sp. BK661 TaxID=2586991 RepID=UPI00216971B1|nr:hypothetical protein [Rhizobium sp. BK661]MCS3744076.1 hypothetical protein [Rhizobium sp. BK661]
MLSTAKPLALLAAGAITVAAWAGSAAAAEPLLLDSSAAAPIVGSLMEPIQPYVAGNGGSTSSILQLGDGNAADISVSGSANFSSIQQSGQNNRAIQSIEGNNSALLLVQGGKNNSVVQAAKGDNDFQLVGVSGSNNQVAYVQVGDNLAGALDVRNAQNTTVVALQTPQSGRYLMPTGLNGIKNATVVVVPGRMYVFPKN